MLTAARMTTFQVSPPRRGARALRGPAVQRFGKGAAALCLAAVCNGWSEPGPAIRRGFLLSVPIALTLVLELGFDTESAGAIATAALLNGFPGMDAPAKARRAAGGKCAADRDRRRARHPQQPDRADGCPGVGLLGLLAGFRFGVSLRLAIVGLTVTLAMLISQGLFLPASDAWPALAYATLGALTQVAWLLLVWRATDRDADEPEEAWSGREAVAALRANLTLESRSARHAIRFGLALATGVATYRLLGMDEHGSGSR